MSDEPAAAPAPRGTRMLRVAEHIRARNWTAIGIDFLIVVIGVFVGIQVANWNADRLERVIERETLIRLHAELIRNAAIAEELSRIVALVEWRAAAHAVVVSGIVPHRQLLEWHLRYMLDQTFEDAFIPNHRGGIAYDIAALCAEARIANAVAAVGYQTLERL